MDNRHKLIAVARRPTDATPPLLRIAIDNVAQGVEQRGIENMRYLAIRQRDLRAIAAIEGMHGRRLNLQLFGDERADQRVPKVEDARANSGLVPIDDDQGSVVFLERVPDDFAMG